MRVLHGLLIAAIAAGCPGPKSTGPTTGTGPDTGTGTGTGPDTGTGPVAVNDPATVVDGDVTDAWVKGVHVLVKRTPGADTTATQLYIQGGVRNWGKSDAGVEQLAIATATTGGTETLDKDAFARRLAELGSLIGGGTSDDFSTIGASSLTATWDETFALLIDTFRHPALPPAQLEVVRAQQLSGLKHEQEFPDGRLALLIHQTIWKGHPYQNRSIGTLETVADLTLDEVKAHLARLRETSRLLLVVVGDVDANHVIAETEKLLGDLPRGSYEATELAQWTSDKGGVTIVDDKLPTNYIQAVFPVRGGRIPDFMVAWVAMARLSEREFEEVRTKRNLSYAPGAWFTAGALLPMGAISVTAVDPKTTMQVMLAEAKRLRDEPIDAKSLAGTKATLLTRTYMAQQTPGAQGSVLASAQLFGGDWRLVRTVPDRVKAVTAEQIQTWAARRLTKVQTFVIGDRSKIDTAALEAF